MLRTTANVTGDATVALLVNATEAKVNQLVWIARWGGLLRNFAYSDDRKL